MNHAVVRRVATEMLRCKGKLMELLRAEDITKTGERGMDERDGCDGSGDEMDG